VVLELDEIQGNILAGFNKDHEALVLVAFPSAEAGRRWLADLAPEIASSEEVEAFNRSFRAAVARTGGEATAPSARWVNVAISHAGLTALERPREELVQFPEEFRAGMKRRAELLGDAGSSAPSQWPAPYQDAVHAVVIVAADRRHDLQVSVERQQLLAENHGLEVVFTQYGQTREDEPGHEHFGFRDGISQPGMRGLTVPSDPSNPDQGVPGQDLLWPGEFVIGYPGQAGPGGGDDPGPVRTSGPNWTRNGSYLVFRRLRQDVAGFRSFLAETARDLGMTEDLLGAKMVGRYRSGAPLEGTGPQDIDPALTDPDVLTVERINDFEFAEDLEGRNVPLAAHIRKTYPRDHPTAEGGERATQLHRILRRGIPYGSSLPQGEPTDGAAAQAEFPDDRGLLFLCYQSSIARQFEFVQRHFVNDPDFPEAGAGHDPVITQVPGTLSFGLPGGRSDHVALLQRFVITTGGEYFFQPSISALSLLATEPIPGDAGSNQQRGASQRRRAQAPSRRSHFDEPKVRRPITPERTRRP
jgi:Dyp-type peroxidase family